MEDLKPGMELTGTVRNVIDFGAFVDIGVHQDGLVHISQISNQLHQAPLARCSRSATWCKVWVLSRWTAPKSASALTMKGVPQQN